MLKIFFLNDRLEQTRNTIRAATLTCHNNQLNWLLWLQSPATACAAPASKAAVEIAATAIFLVNLLYIIGPPYPSSQLQPREARIVRRCD